MQLPQFILRNRTKRALPRRKPDGHKGDYGRVLVIAGSSGMTGAAVLASRGALRSGAGLTYLAVPGELLDFVDTLTPEVITLSFQQIKKIKPDAVAIGPGMGTNAAAGKLVNYFLRKPVRLVIDADALNIIARNPGMLKKAKANIIITPHPGELSRLLKKSVPDIQKNRQAFALETAKRYKCVVVLKGHRTVIAGRSGELVVNMTGNPGMASGGVGDVLTGMIAGFLAQGLLPFDAAAAGAYLHGLAGDLAAKEKGQHGMIASDLVEKIPDAIQTVI